MAADSLFVLVFAGFTRMLKQYEQKFIAPEDITNGTKGMNSVMGLVPCMAYIALWGYVGVGQIMAHA